MLTAIVLVKNEEKHIKSVLEHLSWADEWIVVDNGSTDSTERVARKQGATVLSISTMDFSLMRNSAAKKAKNDWILYIDTDEEISVHLKNEISKISTSTPSPDDPSAYVIQRENYYLHHRWPHKDGMVRLIYKPALVEWYGKIHETAKIHGTVSVLKNTLIHDTHKSLEEMLSQTNDWSEIEADLRFRAKHPKIVSWRFIRVLLTGFYDSYISQNGWKAGTVGIIESIYQGFSLFVTYAKLWEIQIKK